MKEKILEMLGYVAKLSTFLTEVQRWAYEMDQKTEITETVENYLDGFNFSQTVPMHRSPEASKPNKKKKTANRKVWTEKEIEEMPHLKNLKYRKTQDGIHQFRYRRNGYNLSFNSKVFEIAKKKAYAFIKNLKENIRRNSELVYGKSLNYVAQAWFNLKRAHVDYSTYKSYEYTYNKHVAPFLGKRSVKSILPMDLQPFFDQLYIYSGKTCETVKITLSGIFKYAVANRLAPTNPMDGVIVEKHVRVPGKALDNEQINEFIRTMKADESRYGLACLIVLYSGVRGAELESLHFDWENNVFTVKNAKLKKSQKVNPDNLTRTLPIFPGLQKLRERIEATDDWRIKSNTLSAKFREHWPNNTIKDLRHTFASKCREAGIENELVNIWQGHTPGNNVTANVYTHFSMDYQQKEAKKVDNY